MWSDSAPSAPSSLERTWHSSHLSARARSFRPYVTLCPCGPPDGHSGPAPVWPLRHLQTTLVTRTRHLSGQLCSSQRQCGKRPRPLTHSCRAGSSRATRCRILVVLVARGTDWRFSPSHTASTLALCVPLPLLVRLCATAKDRATDPAPLTLQQTELTAFALSLPWTKIIPTVGVGSPAGRTRMQAHFAQWSAAQAERPPPPPRGQNYW